MTDGTEVTDNREAGRYEIRVDGELAGFATYIMAGNRVVFLHFETDPRFEGRGLASELARGALSDVRARGLFATPQCPFLVSYVARHPEWVPLVDPAHRGRYTAAGTGDAG